MRIQIAANEAAVGRLAGEIFIETIRANPQSVLGLATGSTPIRLYHELAKAYENGLDFSQVQTFNLDEYLGLPPEHPQSYHSFMEEHLFSRTNIDRSRTHFPCANSEEDFVPGAYEAQIAEAGGIDLQVLGIGHNGHIAFNEPAKFLSRQTSIVQLSDSTLQANARFFDRKEEVPRKAVSSGMATILQARRIVLLVIGESKRDILQRLLREPTVSTWMPASFLHCHPDVTLIADRAAAGDLADGA